MQWSADDIPDLTGSTAVITGATSGLGLASAVALAKRGAHVVLTARDEGRGAAALATVQERAPGASAEVRPLDLASLDSVRAFADAWTGPVRILMNNAGVMAVPYSTSADGYELHIATNHLGHFALTGLLMPWLREAPTARVVTVASFAATQEVLPFEDLSTGDGYDKWKAYSRSKRANLWFALELQRRLVRSGATSVSSLIAHPGFASTELYRDESSRFSRIVRVVGQSPDKGALPQLYAATAPGAHGGEYYAPRVLQAWGAPARIRPGVVVGEPAQRRALWEASEAATGVVYDWS